MGKLLWRLRSGNRPYPTKPYLGALVAADSEAYRRGIQAVDALLLLYVVLSHSSSHDGNLYPATSDAEVLRKAISDVIDARCTPDASRRNTQASAVTDKTELILLRAEREASYLGSDEVRLEHLVLSVLEDSTAVHVLASNGIDVDEYRRKMARSAH